MEINVRLKKNFVTAYNKLQADYGTELARLNGFDDDQLSHTDFINNFIDTKVVADASIDGNSNVSKKDIVTLLNEMPKPHRKLLAFNKIHYEMQKTFNFKTANDWLRAEWIGQLYMHDADTSTFKHYCYKGEELVTVRDKRHREYTFALKDLYENILYIDTEAEERYDASIEQNALFPKNIEILDINEETGEACWTKVTRAVKHTNDKPMRFIKLANGLSQIVTEDHPIITDCGDIPAKEVTNEYRVFTAQPISNSYWKGGEIDYQIPCSREIGWILGMALSEGNSSNSQFVIAQKLDSPQAEKVKWILDQYDIPYTESGDRKIYLKVSPFEQWLNTLLKGQTSATKQLPSYFMMWPQEFMDGVVAGMIDGDGTIDGYKNRHCHIRIASETLCHQLSMYLHSRGIFAGDRTPFRYNRAGSFEQKLPMFGIGFTLTNEEYFSRIGSIKVAEKYIPLTRKGNFKNKQYEYNYGWVSVIDNSEYIDECPEVYDLTTETGHFICNNILSHNCFAYDLKDLAEKGLYFIGAPFNPEPAKHLTTFVDFVKEFISYASNRSSGAVGLPNLIPYMWYFWHKDVESDYLGLASSGNAERYARQNFQRFVYAVNQPYVRDGSQSAFTNTSVFDRPYYEALFGGSEFPDGTFMIDYEDEIIEFQKWYMEEVAEIRTHNMFTFPVLSISLLKQEGKFQDEEFARWAVKHNMRWSDSNLFIDDSVTSLSNCCRLKSDIKDLGYFNSIGGTALKVGSVKVSTINLARLALDSFNEFEFLVGLRKLTLLNLQALHCVRNIIKRNVEKGLLPNFSMGLVDFEHLYNTIGFIGVYETMKRFGYTRTDEFGNVYYTPEASALGQTIFKTMREVADQFIADMGADYHINTEQIPGESAAAKLMRKDKFFYPDSTIFDLPLYGNQFIPLGIQTTLAERVRIAAEFDGYCNGGSILHANIDAPFDSFDKAWDMVNYISDAGVTYFAFNTKIQACDNNHAFYGRTCPVCGRPVETEYTRIVGFYTPIKTWSKERTNEYKMRKWEPVNK